MTRPVFDYTAQDDSEQPVVDQLIRQGMLRSFGEAEPSDNAWQKLSFRILADQPVNEQPRSREEIVASLPSRSLVWQVNFIFPRLMQQLMAVLVVMLVVAPSVTGYLADSAPVVNSRPQIVLPDNTPTPAPTTNQPLAEGVLAGLSGSERQVSIQQDELEQDFSTPKRVAMIMLEPDVRQPGEFEHE